MIVEEQREQFISYQIDNITLPLASKVLNLAYYCYKKFSSKSISKKNSINFFYYKYHTMDSMGHYILSFTRIYTAHF